jgi:hypothetical protein
MDVVRSSTLNPANKSIEALCLRGSESTGRAGNPLEPSPAAEFNSKSSGKPDIDETE